MLKLKSGMILGDGNTKICVSVIGRNEEELEQALLAANASATDLIEIRADYFFEDELEEDMFVDEGLAICHRIFSIIEKHKASLKPMIFTFRTGKEGGRYDCHFNEYSEYVSFAADSGLFDLIDVETFWKQENFDEVRDDLTGILRDGDKTYEVMKICRKVESLMSYVKFKGSLVIASNHDFEKTPLGVEMVHSMSQMFAKGANIAKMAVMPNSEEDVDALMEASRTVCERFRLESEGDGAVISMSMGELGKRSRIECDKSKSAVTFRCLGEPSAPGQIVL